MNKAKSNIPNKIKIHTNGVVSLAEVFVDGIYIYTREYWLSLSAFAQAILAQKHPKIRKVFSDK